MDQGNSEISAFIIYITPWPMVVNKSYTNDQPGPNRGWSEISLANGPHPLYICP